MADRYLTAYSDPAIADISSNISKAFTVDPRSVVARATAEHYRLQNDKLTREAASRTRGGNLLRNWKPGDDVSELAATGYEGDVPIAQTAGTTLYMTANNNLATTPQIQGAATGAGHIGTENSVYSTADRELVAQRNATNDKAKSDSSAGIAAGASMANARLAEDGRMTRRYDDPVHVSPGSGIIFSPGDSRTPTGYQTGDVAVPVPAKPGADKMVVVEGPEGKPVYVQASEASAKGLTATTARQPGTPDTKEAEANAIAYSALQSIGATTVEGNTVTMHPDFLAQFGDKLPAAKEAAVAARQKSKNPGAAETAFLGALGIQPGTMFKPKGTPIFGSGPAAMVPRPGASAVPTPAPAPSPAPAAIPPPAQRQVGMTYPTPKGLMKWTGTGWQPAGQ